MIGLMGRAACCGCVVVAATAATYSADTSVPARNVKWGQLSEAFISTPFTQTVTSRSNAAASTGFRARSHAGNPSSSSPSSSWVAVSSTGRRQRAAEAVLARGAGFGATGGVTGGTRLSMVATDPGTATTEASVLSGGGEGPSPPMAKVHVKPSRHDLETGRDPTRVKVFDTTLRDGEQSPGCTMTGEEKLLVAKQLSKLGVDIIEAGFPIASQGDFKAVHEIASVVGSGSNPPIICGLARALTKDIDRCAEAVAPARFPRIHTFIATSDIHMKHKLKKSREEVLDITKEMVTCARSHVDDVEFSAEDALRSDYDFLSEVYSVAIAAGATTINVPDTVGYTTPKEFMGLMHHLRRTVQCGATSTFPVGYTT